MASSDCLPKTAETVVSGDVLIIWDFDWSLINENSDYFPVKKALGAKYASLGPKWRSIRISQGLAFCEFQDSIVFKYLFEELGLTKDEFNSILSDIPVFAENIQIVKALHKYGRSHDSHASNGSGDASIVSKTVAETETDSVKTSKRSKHGFTQVIMSGANTELVSAITSALGIAHVFQPLDSYVFTNFGFWEQCTATVAISEPSDDAIVDGTDDMHPSDEIESMTAASTMATKTKMIIADAKSKKTAAAIVSKKWSYSSTGGGSELRQRLRVSSYNAVKGIAVDCVMCGDPDMCKGYVMDKELAVGKYARVVYVGDGHNDLCPALRLTAADAVMVRRGKSLHKLTAPTSVGFAKMKASIYRWQDGAELLAHFKSLFAHVSFD